MSSRILTGDCRTALRTLDAHSIQACITSPPYFGLRDYGHGEQIGLEPTLDEYVKSIVSVFDEVRRVLRDDGTVWLNLGDSYVKGQLAGMPWRVAIAMQAAGWKLRSDVIWAKPNPMPESVKNRPTQSHEHVFLLAKRPGYFYDIDAIREPHTTTRPKRERGTEASMSRANLPHPQQAGVYHPLGRNKRTVWTVTPKPFKGAHFAVFPPDLITPCVLAGSRRGDTVLDPFTGAGTTGLVAKEHGRSFVGVELNPEYAEMARARIEAA